MAALNSWKTSSNVFIYVSFLVFSTVGIFYGNLIKPNYTFLRIMEYNNIFILFLGIPFLFLQKKANIPDFLDKTISNKSRFLNPILIGVAFGILDVFVIKLLLHPEPYTELPPFLQPFPYSLFIYFSGALEIEIFYRLIPLTLILLLGNWYASGKYFTIFFWTGILLTSLREPLEQCPDGAIWYISYSLLTGFLMNSFQAFYFKSAGLLASLTLRLGHYLIWHILLGIYVQYLEL